MSLECSECERDLRGGHDPECSRFVPCPACGSKDRDDRINNCDDEWHEDPIS